MVLSLLPQQPPAYKQLASAELNHWSIKVSIIYSDCQQLSRIFHMTYYLTLLKYWRLNLRPSASVPQT